MHTKHTYALSLSSCCLCGCRAAELKSRALLHFCPAAHANWSALNSTESFRAEEVAAEKVASSDPALRQPVPSSSQGVEVACPRGCAIESLRTASLGFSVPNLTSEAWLPGHQRAILGHSSWPHFLQQSRVGQSAWYLWRSCALFSSGSALRQQCTWAGCGAVDPWRMSSNPPQSGQVSHSPKLGALKALPLNDVSSQETTKIMCRSNRDWGG